MVGLMTDADSLHHTICLAEQIKRLSPTTLVCLGGPTSSPLARPLLERNDCIDFVVRGEGEVTFARVRGIIGERCVTCHSTVPTFTGVTQAPAGVVLQTPAGISQNAQRIYQQVVVTRIMPLGNVTQITEQERAVIAAWVKAGAKAD